MKVNQATRSLLPILDAIERENGHRPHIYYCDPLAHQGHQGCATCGNRGSVGAGSPRSAMSAISLRR